MKTIRMKFITEAGKNFFVSMDYAAPELSFAVTLVSCEAAELIERTSTEIALA